MMNQDYYLWQIQDQIQMVVNFLLLVQNVIG